MKNDAEHRLLAVLQDEETAILSGNFAALEELTTAKLALCAQVKESEPDPADLQRISTAILRNAALLKAASEGINDARRTILSLRNLGETKCYGHDGSQVTIRDSPKRLERKA